MQNDQANSKFALKTKKRGFPVGRLGAHVKDGINATYAAFFQEYEKNGLPRIGGASIRP